MLPIRRLYLILHLINFVKGLLKVLLDFLLLLFHFSFLDCVGVSLLFFEIFLGLDSLFLVSVP